MTIQSLPLLHVIEPIPASDSALAALNLMLDLAINQTLARTTMTAATTWSDGA